MILSPNGASYISQLSGVLDFYDPDYPATLLTDPAEAKVMIGVLQSAVVDKNSPPSAQRGPVFPTVRPAQPAPTPTTATPGDTDLPLGLHRFTVTRVDGSQNDVIVRSFKGGNGQQKYSGLFPTFGNRYTRRSLGPGGIGRLIKNWGQPTAMSKADAAAFGLSTSVCAVCGRKLTDPESQKTGIGPVCAKTL